MRFTRFGNTALKNLKAGHVEFSLEELWQDV